MSKGGKADKATTDTTALELVPPSEEQEASERVAKARRDREQRALQRIAEILKEERCALRVRRVEIDGQVVECQPFVVAM